MSRFEIEQKFHIKKTSAFRKLLKKHKAKLIQKGQEKNELWDCQNLIRKKGSVLRLRETNGEGLLTFKGPRLKGRYKKRLEYEIPVDFKACRKILILIGFKVVAFYEKYREEYKVEGAHVTLDKINKLGWFAEIEGSPAQIKTLSEKFGFTYSQREERSYLEMIYGSKSVWRGK